MAVRYFTHGRAGWGLAGLLLLTLAAPEALGQGHAVHGTRGGRPAESCPQIIQVPCPPTTTLPPVIKPDEKIPPIDITKPPPDITTPPIVSTAPPVQVASAALGGAGLTVPQSMAGYVESAIPATMFRLRFDAAYRNNRPDRAEYFYAKCGCFQTSDANGPPLAETSVDYQDLRSYFEYAFSDRFSAFIEVPYRFLNPDINANTAGLGDLNFGVKAALLYDCDRVLSLQLRAWAPTGDSDRGLGTDHYTIEPGLLLWRRLSDRLLLEAELTDWIPINGSDFAGNVLRYGVAVSYVATDTGTFRIVPVVEFVGWTVLDGMEFLFPENVVQDAQGDTIVNVKLGVRFGFGQATEPGLLSNSDLYVGYGRALTGEVWYKDLFRVEYRIRF
jgi:hypothetical protein